MKIETLNEARIAEVLETEWIGKKICYFNITDSTNIQARHLAEEGSPHGTLVVAGSQQAGKGRSGRTWNSEPGSGIFMTLLLRPQIKPNHASMLTLVAAMAVTKAIRENMDLPIQIKWPNDIVFNGKKICGILTEISTDIENIHYVLVGIGVNVANQQFPEELSQMATSLFLESEKEIDRAFLLAEVSKAFEYYYARFCETADMSVLCEEYNTYLVNVHKQVRILDPKGTYEGIALGINAQGELRVKTADVETTVSSGEVSVRGIYGYV